jgi:hypothetical protein
MIVNETGIDAASAQQLLDTHGSVRKAVENVGKKSI